MVQVNIEKLALDFIFLHQSALTTGKKQVLTFNTKKHCYSYQNRTQYLSTGVQFGAIPSSKGPPSSPEHEIIEPVTFEKYMVVFYPDGKTQSGAVYLSDEAHHHSYALTVPVSHVLTIYKYRYFKNHWERI